MKQIWLIRLLYFLVFFALLRTANGNTPDAVQERPSYWRQAQARAGDYARLSTKERATLLQQLLRQATDATNPEREKYGYLYFVAFPDSFETFVQLFGYADKTGPALLYDTAEDHLNFFRTISGIPKGAYLGKQINIARGGDWQADAVSMFQDGLRKSVENDLHATARALQAMPENQVKSFWYFYFAGPHPAQTIPAGLNAIASVAPEVYLTLQQAHQQALTEWQH